MLIVTTGGVLVVYEISSNYRDRGQQVTKEAPTTARSDELDVVSVIASNITDDGVKHVRFQVVYEGDGTLALNDTLIQLRTDLSISDLHYRNGTTNRSVTDGFYTQ